MVEDLPERSPDEMLAGIGRRIGGAEYAFEAAMASYHGSLCCGTPGEIGDAHAGVMNALEVKLDLMAEHAHYAFLSQGQDPERRHER